MNTAFTSSSIDPTLLQGLEPVMSVEEQAKLTAMMTSGDANELAKASKIKQDLTQLLHQGILPHQRTEEHSMLLEASFRAPPPTSTVELRLFRPAAFNDRELRVAQEKKENDHEQQLRNQSLPLPVRMPRCIRIEPYDPDGTPVERKKLLGVVGRGGTRMMLPSVVVVDDTWNGNLGDAFTKITVKPKRTQQNGLLRNVLPNKNNNNSNSSDEEDAIISNGFILQHEFKSTPGYDEIIRSQENGYDTKLLSSGAEEPRIVVAAVKNDAAKLGLQRGDVITHVNGEPFFGTAEEFNFLVKQLYASASDSQPLELIVNAELSVAQALKLRAFG